MAEEGIDPLPLRRVGHRRRGTGVSGEGTAREKAQRLGGK